MYRVGYGLRSRILRDSIPPSCGMFIVLLVSESHFPASVSYGVVFFSPSAVRRISGKYCIKGQITYSVHPSVHSAETAAYELLRRCWSFVMHVCMYGSDTVGGAQKRKGEAAPLTETEVGFAT